MINSECIEYSNEPKLNKFMMKKKLTKANESLYDDDFGFCIYIPRVRICLIKAFNYVTFCYLLI